jgi:peptide/nickel transport system permease protein
VTDDVQTAPGVEAPTLPLMDEDDEVQAPSRTLKGDAWRRLRKNRLALAGRIWIIFVILVAATADIWAPKYLGDPIAIDTTKAASLSLKPPSLDHPFGTDKLGRDIASRVVYGARVSLLVGVVAVAIMIAVGMVLGAIAAYYGGVWDSWIMRLADIFYAFPYVLFAVALIAVLGKGLQNVFLAIGILGWPTIARVFRSSILTIKETDYVDAARAVGASNRRIIFRHISPNSMAPIIVYGTMAVGAAILTEAALSFLGMGVQPPTPSWGGMLSESRSYMTTAPWLMLYPGIAILTTVLAFVLLGDGLRDALDVKMKE